MGSYALINHARAKKTIIGIIIKSSDEASIKEANKYIDTYLLVDSLHGQIGGAILSLLEITTTPLGYYGICSQHTDKKVKSHSIELIVSVEYRGCLQWSLYPFIDLFTHMGRGCEVISTIIKKE